MAKIGLNNFRYAKATIDAETGVVTYENCKTPAKAISFSFEPTLSDASLYADDGLAERDSSVTGGDVTMGIDREDLETLADMLGHTYANNEIIDDVADVAPYVGVGRVTTLMVDNERKYRATVLSLVKFEEPSEEDNTTGESVEFSTTEISGKMAIPASGKWRHRKMFDSKTSAISYIEGLLSTSVSI